MILSKHLSKTKSNITPMQSSTSAELEVKVRNYIMYYAEKGYPWQTVYDALIKQGIDKNIIDKVMKEINKKI